MVAHACPVRVVAIGTMRNGKIEVTLARTSGSTLAAIDYGRRLFERGASRSACLNQDEMAGWDEAEGDATVALNGLLQRLIDEAEQTAEYESWLDDEEFFRRGC